MSARPFSPNSSCLYLYLAFFVFMRSPRRMRAYAVLHRGLLLQAPYRDLVGFAHMLHFRPIAKAAEVIDPFKIEYLSLAFSKMQLLVREQIPYFDNAPHGPPHFLHVPTGRRSGLR